VQKILGVFSIKGGVGKTATAVNLAYLSARGRNYTLLWDLDPQAASTFYFRIKPKVRGGVAKLLDPDREIDERIQETDYPYLDVLPADTSYRNLDLVLDDLTRPKAGLSRVLKPLAADYDFIFLDCPPSLSLLSENVFRAADVLIVPVIPTPLSLRTLEQLAGFCDKSRISTPIIPFFSMVDRRKKLHNDIVDQLKQDRPEVLKTEIPYASHVEHMGTKQAPLHTFARSSPAQEAFGKLWREVRARLRKLDEESAEAKS
jgi:cellulose biosynthesis protein BcsQ